MKLFLLISLILTSSIIVRAAEEDATINEEAPKQAEQQQQQSSGNNEESSTGFLTSPFARTRILFVQPETTDLQAGRLAKILIGFQNNGTNLFIVDRVDASFRYPQDFSFSIQNFTSKIYSKPVQSGQEATFEYLFTPSETFSSRQFGLSIIMHYRNNEGKPFINSVFNSTINVVEPDEGLDGETFLLYIFLTAIVVLLGIGAHQLVGTWRKKSSRSSGTSSAAAAAQKLLQTSGSSSATSSNSGEIDFEWIPREHLSAKTSPKTSPRQRRAQTNNPEN